MNIKVNPSPSAEKIIIDNCVTAIIDHILAYSKDRL